MGQKMEFERFVEPVAERFFEAIFSFSWKGVMILSLDFDDFDFEVVDFDDFDQMIDIHSYGL